MDALTFIAEVVRAIVWPATVLIIFHILREPIQKLVPFLEKLKYGNFEMGFSKKLEQAAEEAEDTALPASTGDTELLDLADYSPRAAIIEAWIELEQAAKSSAKRKNAEVQSRQLRSPSALVGFLREAEIIDNRRAGLMDELRHLRNSAAHAYNFEPTSEEAAEYIRLAARLEAYLNET